MNHWLILNIPETDDKDAVKRAYMNELTKHNPEDDPEGFRNLRAAYEAALAEIDEKAAGEADNSPIGIFMRKAESLYKDFAKRREPAAWRELLQDDICARLDTEDEINKRLLAFFMDNYNMPAVVWQTLDARFGWGEKKDELKKVFPADYIEYVLSRAKYDYLDYNMFDASAASRNIDRFILLFNETEHLIYDNNIDAAEAKYAEIIALGVAHPGERLLKAGLHAAKDENEQALDIAKAVYLSCPDNFAACTFYASILQRFNREDYTQEALLIYKRLNKAQPKFFRAIRGVAECLITAGDHEEARTFLREAMNLYPSDIFVLSSYAYVTNKLVSAYEEKRAENPEDYETAITLCKHYLNCNKYDECYKVLSEIKNPEDDPRYYEYMGGCFSQRQEYDKAIEFMQKGLELERNFYTYGRLVDVLTEAGRFEEALKYADEAFTVDEIESIDKAYLYYHKGLTLTEMKQYDNAIASFEAGLSVNSQVQYLHIGKAKACRDAKRYAQGARCCENAINILPYNPEPYIVLMDIYTDVNQPERAIETFERAANIGIDSAGLRYFKACALLELSKPEETLEVLKAVISGELDSDTQDTSYKYQGIALRGTVYFEAKNYELAEADLLTALEAGVTVKYAFSNIIDIYVAKKDYKTALEWLKHELTIYENAGIHLQEAWLYRQLGMKDTAGDILIKTAADYPGDDRVRWRLAKHYESVNDYEKAIEQYKIITDRDPDRPDVIDEIANCMAELGNSGEAIKLITETIEQYPDNLWLYTRRGIIYMDDYKPDLALSDLLRAVSDTEKLAECWRVEVILNRIGRLYEIYNNDAVTALQYFEKALTYDPGNINAIRSVGHINEYYYKNYTLALEYYNRWIALDPSDADAYQARARALSLYSEFGDLRLIGAPSKHYYRKDYKRAIESYKNDLLKDSLDASANLDIANCYLGLGEYEKAFKHYNIALKNAQACKYCPPKKCHEALFGLCQYYVKKRKIDIALQYLEEAIQITNQAEYNVYKRDLLKK